MGPSAIVRATKNSDVCCKVCVCVCILVCASTEYVCMWLGVQVVVVGVVVVIVGVDVVVAVSVVAGWSGIASQSRNYIIDNTRLGQPPFQFYQQIVQHTQCHSSEVHGINHRMIAVMKL
jgi:uncharacterized membrane protein YjgN (DUF898 family)